MHPKVVISIINYRTGELTRNCAQSVLDDIGELNAEIVIVDNASGDGSAEALEEWIHSLPADSPIRLVRSATNSGFSGGHNQGMATSAADYYLVLNSDAVLRSGFLQAIVAAAERSPAAGLIAPQIETEDGEIQVSCFRFHTPTSEFVRGAGSGPISRIFASRTVALPPPVQQEQIEWASFACILLRSSMVDQIGPMDEGYFLYFEDAEYCLRARREGWRIIQATDAVAVHFRGGSGPVKALEKAQKRLPAYYYASRARFFRQSHGVLGPTLANTAWLTGRLLCQTRRLLGKHVPRTIENEARDIWINTLDGLGPSYAPEPR